MASGYKQHDRDGALQYYTTFAWHLHTKKNKKCNFVRSAPHTGNSEHKCMSLRKNQRINRTLSIDSPGLDSWRPRGKMLMTEWEKTKKDRQRVKMDQGDLAKASAFKWRGAAALRCLGYGCFFKQISQWEAVMVGQTKDHVTGFQQKRRHGGQGLLTQRKAAELFFSPVAHLAQ